MEPMQPTERFSDRAAVYTRGRPTYPDAIVSHLRAAGALPENGVVVDIGVGTGLSAEPFLRAGCSRDRRRAERARCAPSATSGSRITAAT